MKYFSLALSISILISLSSCSISKRVNYHQDLLQNAITQNLSPQEKLDVLGTSVVKMMDHSLQFVNPKKGVKFVKQYGEANQKNLGVLLKDVRGWQNDMNTLQAVKFGVDLLQKPYTKDLVTLIPKFERKYKQIKFVNSLTKDLKSGITNFGKGKLLGN